MFSSLRQRILVIASTQDSDSFIAFQNYGAVNADKLSLEKFQQLSGRLHSQYASISLFASMIDFNTICNSTSMSKFYSLLHPGGTMNFHVAIPKETGDEVVQKLTRACVYAGFIDSNITRDKENAQLRRTVQLVAQRPSWEQGSGASITADGLIDETTLLDESEVYVPMGKGKSDCSSKPRACDNCTCGRKELEVELGAEEARKRLENATVRSSCGNCYLGDAFRCSGCPYKGQPAFKPGEKIQLDLDQSNKGQSDLVLTESGDGIRATTTGALKLQV